MFGEPAPRMHELAERERQAQAGRAESGPLPEALRRKFEQSLGQDLGDVEVQVGPEAAHEAGALHAHAVTQGKTIRFADSTYDPASPEGERLLAHEVIHTVQQEHAGVAKAQGRRTVSEPGDAAEVEAEEAARAMVRGEHVQVSQAPEPRTAKKPAAWAKAPASVLLEQTLGVLDQAVEALGQKTQGADEAMG